MAEFESLRLGVWARTLGFRGHVLTKSRAHSATYAALRVERAARGGTTRTRRAHGCLLTLRRLRSHRGRCHPRCRSRRRHCPHARDHAGGASSRREHC
ncbi:replication initiator [Streptomyces sp. MOE7]|uniref:replication initiator n=1 Tax=Streptomyces sp. MOE7 TaxID=1961713 RepID=UPI0030145C48